MLIFGNEDCLNGVTCRIGSLSIGKISHAYKTLVQIVPPFFILTNMVTSHSVRLLLAKLLLTLIFMSLHREVIANESAAKISRLPLILTKGGTAENPAVFDGEGMVIDLGTESLVEDWDKDGDVWTSKIAVYGPNPISPGQSTGLFVDEVPITIARDLAAERERKAKEEALSNNQKNTQISSSNTVNHIYLPPTALKPGQMGCTSDGKIYFRWPEGKQPFTAKIVLLPKPWTNGVTIACSHIIVRNVTAKYASNDGFNIHNKWVGIRLENVKALCNADEGISAHGDVQMDVDGAEIAWNGSYDGGVADVDRSRTTYKNCVIHDNVGAAFKFSGKEHRVTDSLIYNQKKDFTVSNETVFSKERITWKQD